MSQKPDMRHPLDIRCSVALWLCSTGLLTASSPTPPRVFDLVTLCHYKYCMSSQASLRMPQQPQEAPDDGAESQGELWLCRGRGLI